MMPAASRDLAPREAPVSGRGGAAELAVFGPAEERIPLGPGEDQGGSLGMPGIAHRNLAAGEEGDLHAVAAGGTAAAAPDPPSAGQGARVHAVANAAHGNRSISSSRVRMISLDSSGGAAVALSLSMTVA